MFSRRTRRWEGWARKESSQEGDEDPDGVAKNSSVAFPPTGAIKGRMCGWFITWQGDQTGN